MRKFPSITPFVIGQRKTKSHTQAHRFVAPMMNGTDRRCRCFHRLLSRAHLAKTAAVQPYACGLHGFCRVAWRCHNFIFNDKRAPLSVT
ncbi:hypothetical protein EKH80_13685 [Dyella choica]|uniref:Uncharacterized protein n=1 Tax=Dyella choica TaxID=1927959 RepID=A0A3S0RZR9_9GAMM|nr:hypothetical protein EKH80_13685 [Dyella choica]